MAIPLYDALATPNPEAWLKLDEQERVEAVKTFHEQDPAAHPEVEAWALRLPPAPQSRRHHRNLQGKPYRRCAQAAAHPEEAAAEHRSRVEAARVVREQEEEEEALRRARP